jgi:ribosomal protein S18 acetylase RimI-like enzyme
MRTENTDAELARRSILGFGEIIFALGAGAEKIRRPDAVGARILSAPTNPWFNGAVVPPGLEPPVDDADLPYGLWTVSDSAAGRIEAPEIATPVLGLWLKNYSRPPKVGLQSYTIGPATLAHVGDFNERAYEDVGVFGPLVRALENDANVRAFGLSRENELAAVALTLQVGDDLGIHYVATNLKFRRRGFASALVSHLLIEAQTKGLRSATLQASAEGLPVWLALGFRHGATLRGFVRPVEPSM